VPPVDQVALETRAAELATRSIKQEAKRVGLRLAISMTDLTTLEGRDTPGKVRALCQKAMHPLGSDAGVPPVAAVCVYPDLVSIAAAALSGSGVAVASVATGFPSGRTSRAIKVEETRRAVQDGAGEIDMVIDRGAFHAGLFGAVYDEICAVKEVCGAAHLKVILETGELGGYDAIRRACRIALRAGADFLKTSTGKISPAATLPVVLLMLECVRDHYLQSGRLVGVKAAGGIRDSKQALRYLVLVNETVGDLWLTPERFRFGASTLLNDLLMQWSRCRDGVYQRPEDFGKD
jgi:deoxyribose-phosphate aldolase